MARAKLSVTVSKRRRTSGASVHRPVHGGVSQITHPAAQRDLGRGLVVDQHFARLAGGAVKSRPFADIGADLPSDIGALRRLIAGRRPRMPRPGASARNRLDIGLAGAIRPWIATHGPVGGVSSSLFQLRNWVRCERFSVTRIGMTT